jgi:hypothetical protein
MTGAYTPRPMHDGQAQALTKAILEVDDIERPVERDPAARDGRRRYRALLRRGMDGPCRSATSVVDPTQARWPTTATGTSA